MSNTQELCRFDRSGVLNGGPKGRQNTKTRNFLRKKLQKLGFYFGGQTAPSEPAPRVGSGGDVLAGLLPSHSNKKYHFKNDIKNIQNIKSIRNITYVLYVLLRET